MINIKNRSTEKGYIALSTVLITLALVLLIGLSSSLLSINDLQSSQTGKKSNASTNLIESCTENVLLKLNEDAVINSGQMSLPDGDCSVTINSQVGDTWDFSVSGTLDTYSKRVRVSATRGTSITINSWIDE